MFNNIPYFTRNSMVLDNPKVNCYFEDLLDMTIPEFDDWVRLMRATILKSWNETGSPPRSGSDTQEIIDEFERLSSRPVGLFTHTDELNAKNPKTASTTDDVIFNKARDGSVVDQFFPTMMCARINFTLNNDAGISIYDMFANADFEPRMLRGCKRHFRRDSFYHYSSTLKKNSHDSIIPAASGKEWIIKFQANRDSIFKDYDFWLCEEKVNDKLSTGYNQVLQSNQLSITEAELVELRQLGLLTQRNQVNIGASGRKGEKVYVIRLFKLKTERIFPHGFTTFRIGYTNVAVNFPPMTAKYLYERYTDHIKHLSTKENPLVIYDPSSGWGGRILGAMSVKDDRFVHYVGTDPNTDNYLTGKGISRYDFLASFFNKNTSRNNEFFTHANTFETFTAGSEEIHRDPAFQKYKGKIDLIFTSPPYFNREAYSDDSGQSYKNFPEYDSWRVGFLRKTLETCYEYLKPDRYLLWNIADIKVGGKFLPLEQDSIDILQELGMVHVGTLKMVMKSMPGANRLDKDGLPMCKNFCLVNGEYLKYEPIFVFHKP